jgi:shikimate kinase
MQDTQAANSEQAADIPGNIFLVGMMGAGKTSVGRVLAKRLNKAFYDSDQVIEQRTGVKISLIFEIEGEAGFRHRESVVLDEMTGLEEVVLATGGGAVLAQENRNKLRSRAPSSI